MKYKFRFLILILLAILPLQSCKHKNGEKLPPMPVNPREVQSMTRTAKDTADLINLTKQYLDLLKTGKIDQALSMLYIAKGDTGVIAISKKQRDSLKSTYKAFPVLTYNIDEMYLYSDSDTEVRYTTTFFKKPAGDDRPNTMKFVLNPKKVMGHWILTISNMTTENNFKND